MIKEVSSAVYPKCPIRNILARVSDKWSMLVLYELTNQSPMRFGELQKRIADASPKMLTITLRTLEEYGIVKRTVYAVVPPRVEYELTERGVSLLDCMRPLIDWADKHMTEILTERTNKLTMNKSV